MAMNSPEAAVDALQESLRQINDDIIANEAQYATLQNIINDDLQPLVVAAREAFREAPHGTADQRHARAALKEELDDSRFEVENANSTAAISARTAASSAQQVSACDAA